MIQEIGSCWRVHYGNTSNQQSKREVLFEEIVDDEANKILYCDEGW